MKNIFNKIQSKINSLTIRTKTAVAAAVDNTRAEGFVDTGVKIIIAVVIGAVILGGLYALFNTVILPRLNTEIGEMFNYAG
jgi:uncharacterized protein (DUF2062 family)